MIFDNDLSPSQVRVLTELCGVQVLDRSGLILDIFAQRARTKEGCLQVELAQYQYLLPRLIGMWSHLERQGGTGGSPIGTKGPGETQLETDRRHIRRKIDKLKEEMRTRHILRMRQGQCSIEAGFVWADLLTDLERTSDHCSNIAGCVIDAARHNLNLHETLRAAQTQDPDFAGRFRDYAQTYRLPEGE